MKFREFLLSQTNRHDSIGALAEDVRTDPRNPDFATFYGWYSYFLLCRAGTRSKASLADAWEEYRALQ